MKISLDFDGTLSRRDVQEFAKKMIDNGHDVWIVTSRYSTEKALGEKWFWIENQNKTLYDVAESVGIKKENIVFTNMVEKINFLQGKYFLFHLDDDESELISIFESGDSCKPLNVNNFFWEENCLEMLNK